MGIALTFAGMLSCSSGRDPVVAFDDAQRAFERGDLDRATKEAENGYRNFHKLGPEWGWKFTILKARVMYRRGVYSEVLKVLASESSPPPVGELAVKRQWLEGLAYSSLHKFSDAEQIFGQAEAICATHYYPTCGDVAGARGNMEMHRGHYAQAQILFDRVLASARASGDQIWEADALLDLSWSADEQTHFDEALDRSDAARRIALERGVPDIAQKALGNMGWAYYKLGDTEKAKGMFIEATNTAQKLGNVASQVGWLTDAGYVDMDGRNFKDAEESFQRSFKLAQQINSREDIINAQIALAFVCEQTGKLEDAKNYADEALSKARQDGNKRDEVYPLLIKGRIAAQQHDATGAQSAFQEVAQAEDSPVFLKWEAERSLARLAEDANQVDSADREYRTALSTFETARATLQHEDSRVPFLTNASRIYDDYIHFLVSRGKTSEALRVADYSRARTLAEGLGLLKKGTSFAPDPLNAPSVARQAGGTVLFYWLGEKQSYLWAVTPRAVSLFTLPPASEIDAAVQRYRKFLAGPQGSLETADPDGTELYRILVAPAKEGLRKDARVFIIPDGSLNSLSFETLLVTEPALHYWIEDATIANAGSLRLLASSSGEKEKNTHTLLLVGNSVAPDKDYPELPKAGAEMESVERRFPPAQRRVFERAQATPAAYLASKPEQFSYIHFVAHGTASRLSPLDSAIVLSKSSAATDSFKLYARDIIQHPLRAKLVTVSACYGAGSRSYSGEGLVGLAWAFLRAGAHNVIAALWDASDVSTEQLMDKFYEELNRGESPDTALRKAKLSLLRSGSAFRKPFYWAPFQLYVGS